LQEIGDRLDGDDGSDADKRMRERRQWSMRTTLDGEGRGNFNADPEANEIIRTAIKAGMARDRVPDGPRTVEQRRFDAACNIFRRSLENGEVGSKRLARPHIRIVLDISDDACEATTEFSARFPRRRSSACCATASSAEYS
jgi:hypothetical protein